MLNSLHRLVATSLLLVCAGLPNSASANEPPQQTPPKAPASSAPSQLDLASVGVTLDFAKVLTFSSPARTVIIGNPGIVDGTLSDEHTMVLTGKSVGSTNLIVLGEGRQEVANLTVNVVGNSNQLTTIYHGNGQQVFSCAGPCRPVTPATNPK